ncbi:MAG: acetate--CoA ligase family protein [Dehalococcoidales bacterium]|nr:acetate--CoA ligase family protein [Dehalococcoidales bacterium]MDZ4231136.1 ATP-grasp domain-containing protein [Dehalococcoidales bacterium]
MPKLLEYQGKRLLRECGIAVPEGEIASTPGEARRIAERLSRPVAVKSQIETTGRFKAGGIRFAETPAEAESAAAELLGKEIKGFRVEKVLVEEKLAVELEFYVSIAVNDSYKVKGPVLMLSTEGGVDIEEVASKSPEKVAGMNIDILSGLNTDDVKKMVSKLGISAPLVDPLSEIIGKLYGVFRKYSARSAEINPLVVTADGNIYPADCRVVIDEASVFKYPELEMSYPRDIGRAPTELEWLAWKVEETDYRGIGYFVQMATEFKPGEGYVGFHGIGGGGAMLGADALIRHGLKLADYADTSGSPTASKVYRIVKLIFAQPNIDAYVLMGPVVANQEQWHHAHALVRALREELEHRPGFPVIILIAGNKEAESLEILREGLKGLPANIEIYGRDYVYKVDDIARRLKELIADYRRAERV